MEHKRGSYTWNQKETGEHSWTRGKSFGNLTLTEHMEGNEDKNKWTANQGLEWTTKRKTSLRGTKDRTLWNTIVALLLSEDGT